VSALRDHTWRSKYHSGAFTVSFESMNWRATFWSRASRARWVAATTTPIAPMPRRRSTRYLPTRTSPGFTGPLPLPVEIMGRESIIDGHRERRKSRGSEGGAHLEPGGVSPPKAPPGRPRVYGRSIRTVNGPVKVPVGFMASYTLIHES
jgi:hypothetical protein